jgi:hypothetical protein
MMGWGRAWEALMCLMDDIERQEGRMEYSVAKHEDTCCIWRGSI